jgi:hypothetical protein
MHVTSIRVAVASLFLAGLATAGAPPMSTRSNDKAPNLENAAQRALSADPATAALAIKELRAAGYAGVDAIFAAAEKTPGLASAPALDKVCGQFDCATSRLFWHTDLEQAKAAAAAQGKPILSLRLLGNLDEELSCANSRFFRATLYPNADVNQILRKDFILHWQSVRPVPKVTIDFGDGRTLERTLTGNSIHYVLDAKGRPVDGIPGLHGAKAFAGLITRAGALAKKTAPLDGTARKNALREFHGSRLATIAAEWERDLAKLGVAPAKSKGDRLAVLEKASADRWDDIAARHAGDAELDDASRRASRKLLPPSAWDAGRLAMTKRVVEDPMLKQFDVLQRSLALDGVVNELTLHPKLHRWFEEGSAELDVSKLNERVYDEIFLMPLNDPWLGLSPRESFSGITGDGRRGLSTL